MAAQALEVISEEFTTTEQKELENLVVKNRPQQADIAVAAYYLWQERGCPTGTDQEDWFRAEAKLTE